MLVKLYFLNFLFQKLIDILYAYMRFVQEAADHCIWSLFINPLREFVVGVFLHT